MNLMPLGASDVQVPHLGVGVMIRGQPSGRARFSPAQLIVVRFANFLGETSEDVV